MKFPIPVPRKGDDGKLLRWKGVNPAMMWLRLFWLPPRLASPRLASRYATKTG